MVAEHVHGDQFYDSPEKQPRGLRNFETLKFESL